MIQYTKYLQLCQDQSNLQKIISNYLSTQQISFITFVMNKVFFYINSFISIFPSIKMQPENYLPTKFPQKWQDNKNKMFEILKKAPVVGIYKNQSPADWDKFFQFYIDFLNMEIGPRGQCAKKVRQQLKNNRQIVDQVLKPYNLNHSIHIRSLYVRFKFFIPCQQYNHYTTVLDTLTKCEQNLFRLKQPFHPMYKSIMEGMLRKHGPDYAYKEQIAKLKQNYEVKIEGLQKNKIQLQEKLNISVEYQNWKRMKTVMTKWFDEWVQADSGMGKESCNRGQVFENKVLKEAIPYIIQRERQFGVLRHIKDESLFTAASINQLIIQSKGNYNKKQKTNRLHIFLNMRWNPRSLGEIDISVVEYIEQKQRYEALILVESKARLFDVRQASYQVFPEYFKINGKVELSGKYGPVYIADNATSYIVTTLPDYEFVFPVESTLKAALDRITKDKPIEQIKENFIKELLYTECTSKFKPHLSPLDWFVNNDSDKIIVLSGDN